jgi:O-antigen/teichoic acid export membrane protein
MSVAKVESLIGAATRLARARSSLGSFFRSRRFVEHSVSIVLRGAAAAGKFALSLYMLAYLGLSELGVFGLLVAAATAAPAVLGFGLSDWTTRTVIGLPGRRAMALVTTRMAFTLAVHAVVQPLFWIGNALAGYPIPTAYALPIALIVLLEHIAADSHGPLVARGRILLSSVNLFIRAGLWPMAIIAVGLVYPPARTLTWVLAAWVAGLVVMMVVLAVAAFGKGRWRWLSLQWDWLRDALTRSWALYLSAMGAVGSLYTDRFIISFFAGLELTGVYVFFWSAANVVHSIAVYGTFHPRVPTLVAAAQDGDFKTFRRRLIHCQAETMAWAILLSSMLWVAVDVFTHIADKPQLSAHAALFIWIILAMLLRILADSYHFVLYALHRDRTIVAVNLAGAATSATLNAILVSSLAIVGAVAASIVTGSALLVSRLVLSRTGGGSASPAGSDDGRERARLVAPSTGEPDNAEVTARGA